MVSPTLNGISTPPSHSQPPQTPPPANPPPEPTQSAPAPTNLANTSAPRDPPANPTDLDEKRPRDARLVHAVLAALGVTAYADRVPLQLMDFAYRYTASILSDGVQLTSDGYTGPTSSTSTTAKTTKEKSTVGKDAEGVALQALRLAIASRLQYQFTAPLAKEFLLELAAERNRVALPRVERGWGVRLPGEKYCFTGTGWGVRGEWEDEEEVDGDEGGDGEGDGLELLLGEGGDVEMGGEEEGEGDFEEVMGVGVGGGGDVGMEGA